MSSNSIGTVPSESERFQEKNFRKITAGNSPPSSAKDINEGSAIVASSPSQREFLDIAGGEPEEEGPEERKLAYASSSVIKFYPEWCQCMECLQAPARFNDDGTTQPTCLGNICRCPPSGPVARIFTFLLEFILTWIFLWILLKDVYGIPGMKSPAHPSGPIFALAILEILGLCLGILFKCFRLPSLLGPLLLGILLRNIEAVNLFKNFEGWNHQHCHEKSTAEAVSKCQADGVSYANAWIEPIRLIALSLILTRAGLELSPKQLKKLKGVVPLLAFGPCIVEAIVCAITTYFIFGNEKIGIFMCFVAGFALAAVSPAVVVPGMLSLKRRRLGEVQGVPTLLIAASSIDDVLAISLYTIFLSLAVHSSESSNQVLEYTSGIIGFCIGIVHGFVMGMFLHFIPAKDLKHLAVFRLILLLLINITTMLFYESTEFFSGAGSVAVLVCSFIASFRWRSESHWKKPMGEIEHHLAHLWTLFVPLLFGTIGREIDFSSAGYTVTRIGKATGVIFISLIVIFVMYHLVRLMAAFFIAKLAKLNFKERVFCAASWIPKATVQAALAPLVISRIQEKMDTETDPVLQKANLVLLGHGQIVVLTAVFAVLITAPLGSVLISFLGPKLLQAPPEDQKGILDEEFPGGDGEESVMLFNNSGEVAAIVASEDKKSLNIGSTEAIGDNIRIDVVDSSGRVMNTLGGNISNISNTSNVTNTSNISTTSKN